MWYRDRNLAISLAANRRESRRFRPSFASAGAKVYVHSIGDGAVIQSFWDRDVGDYSDSPFPPLGGTTLRQSEEQLIMPEFPEGVIPA